MKSLIGGMILLASVNATQAIANDDFATVTCITSNNETFAIFVKGNDALIKWPSGTYPAEIVVEGSKLYLIQNGKYGTFGMSYDMDVGVGISATKFTNGNVINATIRCTLN
jgi:hypothetical protein